MTMHGRAAFTVWLAVCVDFAPSWIDAAQAPAAAPPAVERLGKDLLRVGRVRVDTAAGEVSVRGTVNPVSTLEFLANPPNGLKAYESALTLDTDGVTFNTALILIGLDPAHLRRTGSGRNIQIEGDRVEVWVDLPGSPVRRIPGDQLIFDRETNQAASGGVWIYTGSSMLPGGRFWADSDGVLIGFVHSGPAVIERQEVLGVGRYGSVVLNPNLGLEPGAAVTLVVKLIKSAVAHP